MARSKKVWVSVCVSVIIAVIAYVQVAPLFNELCPESCACNPINTEAGSELDVHCGNRNLTSVPSLFGMDVPVLHFDVSYNTLKVLDGDAFLECQSVKHLYLLYCKLRNINEEAFQLMENLTVVDLSHNLLVTIPPNLFVGNHLLENLILGNNYFSTLPPNIPLLNGPSSLRVLNLKLCKLSNISSKTFSFVPNLKILDISGNKLVSFNPEILSLHRQLEDVNMENNEWKCGSSFRSMLCWMHFNLSASHNRTMKCEHKNKTREIWTPQKRFSLCGPVTTPALPRPHTSDTPGSTANPRESTLNQLKTDTNNHLSWKISTIVLAIICVILLSLLFIIQYIRYMRMHQPGAGSTASETLISAERD